MFSLVTPSTGVLLRDRSEQVARCTRDSLARRPAAREIHRNYILQRMFFRRSSSRIAIKRYSGSLPVGPAVNLRSMPKRFIVQVVEWLVVVARWPWRLRRGVVAQLAIAF